MYIIINIHFKVFLAKVLPWICAKFIWMCVLCYGVVNYKLRERGHSYKFFKKQNIDNI